MAELDSFQAAQIQTEQSEYLKSINQSMSRLVDVNERSLNSSANQFFQGNAVQSTITSLREITQGAYDRFSDDLVTTRDYTRSASQRLGGIESTISGTAKEFASHIPVPSMGPISSVGFFGTSSAYSQNYRSTFWNDLWAGYLGERAPQTMFQSDFTQMGQENISLRIAALSPLRAVANLAGVNTSLDEDVINSNMAISQRYTRSGTSRALSGVGSTRGEVIGVIERERMKLLDQLGYNYDDFQAAKQVFAAGGQFIGTKSEMERSHVTFQGMEQAEQIAKVLAVPIQEAARAMMDVRSQLGITSLTGQAAFVQQTQAIGMASGLSFQEAMGGALAGAGIARNLGYSVRTGGSLGRDILASVNGAYLDRTISESLIQSAGGVQNLSSNLANSAISFATGPGSIYYLASMQGGQFNQQAFNQASGGFAQLGNMAASNASTIQGYANFVANVDSIQAQGGSFNAMAMQRSHLNNIFKSATGRDMDISNTEDTNMMKMLAVSSGMFTDPTTAKAFVEMNFTESGQESMYATQRDAYKAEKNLKFKSSLDQRFKGNSTDALARSISNVWNKPVQGLRGWFNDSFEEVGGRRREEQEYLWSTGQISLGKTSASDIHEFANSGGFSRDISTISGNSNIPDQTPGVFARSLIGGYSGGVAGLQYGGAIGMGALAVPAGLAIAGLGLAGLGGLLSMTGLGAIAGVPMAMSGLAMAGAGATFMPALTFGTATSLVGLGAGIVSGGGYGAAGTYLTPGGYVPMNTDQIKANDKSVAAWNRGGGFSQAEKNTMGDPDFQKKVAEKLMAKGLGSTNKMSAENQTGLLNAVREVAGDMGVSEGMVANIAQTKLGLNGDPLLGADLQWAQIGAANMATSGEALNKDLKGIFGQRFDDLINDSDFTSKFGKLLSAGGDAGERRIAYASFMSSYEGSLTDDAKEKLAEYQRTGTLQDKSKIASELTNRSTNLRSLKLKEDIGSMFGARAKDENFADVADQFSQIASGSNPSQQVGMVLRLMQTDESFKSAIGRDPTLKRLLPLEGHIDKSMLSDAEAFKKRFGSRPTDDLRELQATFDKSGEEGVKARLAGNILATQAKGDTAIGKQNEAQILADAASTIKDAARILKEMKR